MTSRMKLLCPEWQCCQSARVHAAARWLAEALFARDEYTLINAIEQENLQIDDGVIGLHSIAPRFVEALHKLSALKPDRLMMVGGTCGAEAAPVSYLNHRYAGDMAVVWFDAHGDLNTPQSSPSGYFHGMVLRTLLGEGPLEIVSKIPLHLLASQLFLVGVRDLDPAEQVYIATNNIARFPHIDNDSTRRLIDAIGNAGFKRIYMHVDVDVLDPNSFADMLMPTRGGPTLDALEDCVFALSQSFDAVGVSVVEYCGSSQESRQQLRKLFARCGFDVKR